MASTSLSEYDALLNDVSRQMALSQLSRRQSRSSNASNNRRSARIEKPRSHHSSPMAMERRKTITSVKRFTSLDDHWDMMFGSGNQQTPQDSTGSRRTASARPVSWHPTSSQFSNRRSMITEPAPFPSFDGSTTSLPPSNSEDVPPAQTSHYSSVSSASAFPDLGYIGNLTPADACLYSLSSTYADQANPWHSSSYDLSQQTSALAPTSHPASTDFLPIQHPPEGDEEEEEDVKAPLCRQKSEELIGMGLYDEPSRFCLTSGFRSGTGKGLKLEETWQPPEDQGDEADEGSSDDESVEEVPNPEADNQRWSASRQYSNMSGQSFLFDRDDDDTYTSESWFYPLKQPMAQGAEIGYGWI